MTLKYCLSADDYLQHQLYIASTTKRIKRKRRQGLIVVVLAFTASTALFYETDNKLLTYYFAALSILSLVFYPFYLRNHYKKHYQKFIFDTYKERFDKYATIVFKEETLETFDETGEAKLNYSVFKEIIETSNHIFIKVRTGGGLIIPKSEAEDLENIILTLKTLADRMKIRYMEKLDWKWR
jgi:YcxB-like protein